MYDITMLFLCLCVCVCVCERTQLVHKNWSEQLAIEVHRFICTSTFY